MARRREFDTEIALDRALQLFWRQGYEGTSIADLTEAMGITRPSLYAAFGNKEALFRRVLDRYAAGPTAYARTALTEPSARAAVERLLNEAADLHAGDRNPRGCLLVHGALACAASDDFARHETALWRNAAEAALRERLGQAAAEGDLPPGADPAALAAVVNTVIYGMSVQASGGATREALRRIIDVALRAWPE